MKKILVVPIAIIICFIILFGCGNEKADDTEVHITNPTCEIIESAEAFCDVPMKMGVYKSKTEWDKAVEDTDVEIVIDKKNVYNEAFYEENALVYMADTSSGNSQCEYEGFELAEVDGKMILTIKISYSTDMLLNKLHAYHIFFTMNESDADKIDDVKLELSERR